MGIFCDSLRGWLIDGNKTIVGHSERSSSSVYPSSLSVRPWCKQFPDDRRFCLDFESWDYSRSVISGDFHFVVKPTGWLLCEITSLRVRFNSENAEKNEIMRAVAADEDPYSISTLSRCHHSGRRKNPREIRTEHETALRRIVTRVAASIFIHSRS